MNLPMFNRTIADAGDNTIKNSVILFLLKFFFFLFLVCIYNNYMYIGKMYFYTNMQSI